MSAVNISRSYLTRQGMAFFRQVSFIGERSFTFLSVSYSLFGVRQRAFTRLWKVDGAPERLNVPHGFFFIHANQTLQSFFSPCNNNLLFLSDSGLHSQFCEKPETKQKVLATEYWKYCLICFQGESDSGRRKDTLILMTAGLLALAGLGCSSFSISQLQGSRSCLPLSKSDPKSPWPPQQGKLRILFYHWKSLQSKLLAVTFSQDGWSFWHWILVSCCARFSSRWHKLRTVFLLTQNFPLCVCNTRATGHAAVEWEMGNFSLEICYDMGTATNSQIKRCEISRKPFPISHHVGVRHSQVCSLIATVVCPFCVGRESRCLEHSGKVSSVFRPSATK